MVQILPPRTNLGTQFGQALGGGLAQGAQKGSEVAFQRGMLRDALSSLDKLNPNASPFEKVKSLLSATAGLPDQGRVLQALQPYLMAQSGGQQAANIGNFPGGGQEQGIGNVPVSQGVDPQQFLQRANEQFQGSLPAPSFTPDLFQGTLDPTSLGMGAIPPQYSPEQITQADIEDRSKGFPESPRAAAMQQYNALSRERTNDIVKAAQVQSDIATRSASRQQAQRDFVSAELGIPLENRTPDQEQLLSVAENVGARPEYQKIANDKIRASRIAQEVRKYEAADEAFKRAAKRPNPILDHTRYEDALKNNGAKAKTLIEFGQLDNTFKELADNGWSVSEIAQQLAPLSQDVKKNLDSVKFLPETEERKAGDIQKSYEGMYDFLEKNIKPGKFNPKNPKAVEPGTSLVLLRNGLMKKGFSFQNVDRAISQLVKNGSVELDPYQNIEFQYMSESPAKTLSIYEILFNEL